MRLLRLAAGLLAVALVAGPSWGAARHRYVPRPAHRLPRGTPWVTATAAVLVDAQTGQVLYARNPDLAWPPASTTKMMTALVALERAPLGTMITISPEVARFREGSVVGLPAHARISLHDLLYALLLPSGNDVALAIAEGTAGTVAAFVAQMNRKAWELGAVHTHFTSPHGLYAPDHMTTAYDLAIIARAAMQNPTIREIVQTRSWTMWVMGRPRRLVNHNRLLARYPGADGIKTGYVHQAGLTLAASATREGWRLIAVLLHTGDMYGDAARLLDYGFEHYHPATLASAGDPLLRTDIAGVPLVATVTQTVHGIVPLGQSVSRQVTLDAHLALPVRRGARIGEVTFLAGGRVLQTAPVVAAADASRRAQTAAPAPSFSHFLVRLPLPIVF
jgi:D-alanyl-D-alanine carboxypeptidase (penicillin-binding protein 5/6)